MESLQVKQKYLRENINSIQYQQFWTYLQENVGNLDIERWSMQFIKEIVLSYKERKEKQLLCHSDPEKSFYDYQGGQAEVQFEKNKKEIYILDSEVNNPKADTYSIQAKSNSAISLLESVFDKGLNNKKNGIQINEEKTVKSNGQTSKSNQPNNTVAAFDTSQFWSSSNSSKVHKPSKSNINFNDFDFWSQPKSTQQYSTNSFLGEKKKQNQKSNFTSSKLPNFDELLKMSIPVDSPKIQVKQSKQIKQSIAANYSRQIKQQTEVKQVKAPSPYLKKSYAEQKIVSNAIKVKKVKHQGEIIIKADFKDYVKCFPSLQRQIFKNKQLSVVIDNHQIINRTFLVPDYVMYSIKVIPLDITIKRNYEDFSRLRNALSLFYPGIKLAYLEKNSWFSSTNLENIKKQKIMLEFFLNDLISNKEIRNSRIFEEFLTLKEHKKIKRKFQQFEKLQAPKSIQELCLLDGKVNVTISEDQRIYQQNLKKFQQKMVDFLTKSQNLNETLSNQYRQVSITLENLMNLSNSMIEQTQSFNSRVYSLELQQVENIFRLMKSSINEERKSSIFYSELIKNTYLPFLNYEKYNLKELDQLIEIQQSFLKDYMKRSQFQKIDPNLPYTSDKIKSSKTSVTQQSKSFLVLKYQAGYLSNQACCQAKRSYQLFACKLKRLLFRSSIKKQQDSLKLIEFWRNFNGPDKQSRSV